MFVVVEGPNGIGKSTVAEALSDEIHRRRRETSVLLTREPSSSPLGLAIRQMEEVLVGEALAAACLADRLDHHAREIAPMRETGWVICDRYVPSSLVLQRLDGLELDRIWALNRRVPPPDLTIYLADEPAVIEKRLGARGRRSRLEDAGGPQRELELYEDARRFLDQRGWRSRPFDCHGRTPQQIASELASELLAG